MAEPNANDPVVAMEENGNDNDDDDDDVLMEDEGVDVDAVVLPTVSIDPSHPNSSEDHDSDGNEDEDHDDSEAPPPRPPEPFENAFPMQDDDDDDDGEEEEDDDDTETPTHHQHHHHSMNTAETVMAHIRGTDIHVPTAAHTFLTFLRSFTSLPHSSSQSPQNDDDSTDSKDSTDDDDSDTGPPPPPLYLNRLRDILHRSIGLPSTTTGDHATPITTTHGADLTQSFAIDMIHMYYHDAACQQFYHQIVQHPMELIPLMDLLLQQEYERLLALVVRYSQNNDNDNAMLQNNNNNNNNNDIVNDDAADDAIAAERYGYARVTIQTEAIAAPPRIQVRPYNLKVVSNLRSLDPISMDTLICCKGMIVRCSSIIPDLKVAHFACTMCGHAVTVTIDRGRIAEPNRCATCQTQGSYQLQHNRSIFADKQLIRLQETPDEVPAGQTPASVITFCYDTLVDSVVPGDKVEITGILRAQAIRPNPKISKIKSIYKTYIDVIHFSKISAGMKDIHKELPPPPPRTGRRHATTAGDASRNTSSMSLTTQQQQQQQWTNERIEQLKRLSNDPDIYQKLVQSLAPSIWELDNCKKGILCMLFGGNTIRVKPQHQQHQQSGHDNDDDDDANNENDTTTTISSAKLNKRGDINILLCGDPGTSKSQLLSYVNKLCHRGIYTSGKGSSAVGLTASVVRDPETRDFALESGALVLSDLGICCIDEFDKMSDSTRSVLHEAMEQQTVRAWLCLEDACFIFATGPV